MFFSYSRKIFFLSFLALGIFLQSPPTVAMEEKTLLKSDFQTKPRCISEYLDIFYENAEHFGYLFHLSDDCNTFVNESLERLAKEYAKEDGNPKAKLIYFFTKDHVLPAWGGVQTLGREWQKVYEWLESQEDDPVALHWLGRCLTRQSEVTRCEDTLDKAIGYYINSLEKGFFPSWIFLGKIHLSSLYYSRIFLADLAELEEALVLAIKLKTPEELEARGERFEKAIGDKCFKKAQEYFLEGAQSQDTTTRYHAYKSLMGSYCREFYFPERNHNKAAYWCIKVLDILPDCFLSRLCLSDWVSEYKLRLRGFLFPFALYKPNKQQSVVNDAVILEENKEGQEWLKAFENLKLIASNLSHKDAENEWKVLRNEEAKDREYYEKISTVCEEAAHYLPLALEKEGFTFMTPKKDMQEHFRHDFGMYDPMNPISSDELALRLYTMGNGNLTIAFGNENVQLCDKVMDLLEGPCSLSSLIAYHQQEIQLATTDLEIAEHTKTIDSLNNIIKSFNDMLLVVNPAKIEQFKQTYGFLADMFD